MDAELVSIQEKQAEAKTEKANLEKSKGTIQAQIREVETAIEKVEEEKAAAEAAERARIAAEEEAARQQAAREANTQQTVQSAQTQSAAGNTSSSSQSASTSTNTESNKKQETTVSAPASGSAAAVIAEAKKHLGTPYKWGGTTPSGFDCSGFTSYVFRKVGVSLPRVSSAQQNYGKKVSLNNLQPGDLVFKGKPAYHVGIYIGNGQYIHSPRTGDVVKIAKFNPSKFSSASRVL